MTRATEMERRRPAASTTRRFLADKQFERLEGKEPYDGKRHRLKTIVQAQARHLATFVRGERPEYRAWVGRW